MSRVRRRLPSPALVIAVLALFVSLGGTSFAVIRIGTRQIKDGAVTTRKIRNGTIRSRDVHRNALGPRAILESKLRVGAAGVSEGLKHFAVVTGSGQVRGRGVLLLPARVGPGRYQVFFNRNVAGCAYEAITGLASAGTPGSGYASVAPRAGAGNGVFVSTFDKNGNSANRAFHLIVAC